MSCGFSSPPPPTPPIPETRVQPCLWGGEGEGLGMWDLKRAPEMQMCPKTLELLYASGKLPT